MLYGFVQPGAIRPGLFEVAAPGGRGFGDQPQVFSGMPELEAGRELTRLDVTLALLALTMGPMGESARTSSSVLRWSSRDSPKKWGFNRNQKV